jgi:RHS repeat-associated protein
VQTADAGDKTFPSTDDVNAYWNPAAPSLRSLLARQAITAAGSPGAVHEYGYSTTGDLTEERHWNSAFPVTQPLTSGNTVIVDRTYNNSNLTEVVDGRSIRTDYLYDSNNLYPIQTKVAGVPQEYYAFDTTSGLLAHKEDGNQVVDCRSYDALNRPLSITDACSTNTPRTTTTSYEDGNRRMIATDGGGRVTITEYDQLRRVALNRQLENPATQSVDDSSAGIKVQTRYRSVAAGNHSYRLASNPYRASTSAGASGEETMGWTLTTFDTMGRVLRAETFSGSALPSPWGTNSNSTGATTYTYDGYNTTTIDQAGATRVTTTDGLGRLTQVIERGAGPNGTDAYTYYGYDGLDDLATVTQGVQTRAFSYDSLSRLTKAVNSESGTTCYAYDNDGNLQSRTQAANSSCGGGIVTSYAYDNLNRMTSKVMPEGTVTYQYDLGSYGIGHLYSVTFGGASTTYSAHDPLGRVTAHTQVFAGIPYNFSYSYNGSDDLTSMTYPSNRQVVFGHDTAGRVNQVSAGGTNYAASVAYGAHGAVDSFQFGNGLWETTNYNSRLQTQQVSLGSCAQTGGPNSPACSEDQWSLQNVYSLPGVLQNNGNILQQTMGLPGGVQISAAYRYDSANRLLVASEQSSNPNNPPCPDSGSRYCQGFAYDAWGNRTVSGLSGMGPSILAPASFDGSTNRISSSGWLYETTGRGNIVKDPMGSTYIYDSENRQVAYCTQDPSGCVNQDGPGRTRYIYDGDGRRVQKSESAGITTYVYDVQGNLAAEYSTAAVSSGTRYLTADQLGSTRVITTGTPGAATVVARWDYWPFGDQVMPSGTDPRLNVVGYGGANPGVTTMFTGKERDSETGLDFFGARYFSGAQGRFTSPDDPLADQSAGDPQSWNLYSYVRNNPLSNIDPTGQDCVTTSNQTSSSVSVAVAAGGTESGCTKSGGAWVAGTVDMKSLTYNGSSVGYSYTPYDTNSLTGGGTIPLGNGPVDALSPYGQEFYNQMSARRESSNHMIAEFGMAQVGFAGLYMGTYAGPALWAAMTAGAPLLPAVPSAIQKLQKIGLTIQQANEIVESPASQKLIDNANNGNINYITQVGGKLLRITTDPTGQRIISAGIVRANSIVNGLANGRFTQK